MNKSVLRISPALVAILMLLSGCAPPAVATPTPTPSVAPAPVIGLVAESVQVDAAVLDVARSYVAEQYDWWSHNTGAINGDGTMGGELATYDDWRIDGLDRVWQYEALDGLDIDVYRLIYRLHTTTPDQVSLAGSVAVDVDGWVSGIGVGTPYLYFDVTADGGPVYLFSLPANDCSPGNELFTSDLQYKLLTEQLRLQAEAQALDYLRTIVGENELHITRLEPYQTFREIADFPVMAWQMEWEYYTGEAWYPTSGGLADKEAYYLFFRVENKVGTFLDCKIVGPDDLEWAATEALWGVADLEFALTRMDPKDYFGIGGPIVGLMDSPGTAEVIDTHGDAIYAEGDFWEETNWDGLSALCYVTAAGVRSISSLTTTLPGLFTDRGISVGSRRETVEVVYPEATNRPNWSFEGDFLWYGPEGGDYGYYLVFYFEGDTVARIELVNMFN